jgi:hypothetical protein
MFFMVAKTVATVTATMVVSVPLITMVITKVVLVCKQ